mgnify:CR=1 FL=1
MNAISRIAAASLAPLCVVPAARAAAPARDAVKLEPFGLVFLDAAWLDGAAAKGRDDHKADLALAELGLDIKHGAFTFRASYDFSGDGAWRDVGAFFKQDGWFLGAGQFKEPASLDKLSLPGGTIFLESARFTKAFGLNRRLGVWAGRYDKDWSVTLNASSGTLDGDDHYASGTGQTSLGGRATWSPAFGEARLHLGAYARALDYDGSGVKPGAAPYAELAAKTLYADLTAKSPTPASDSLMGGLEAAWSAPGVFIGGEIAAIEFDTPAGSRAASGGYVQASWAITGEQRRHAPEKGAFDRIIPSRPLSQGGPGGWELAGRVDHLDLGAGLDSAAYTAGVTWTPERDLRLMINYVAERGRTAVGDSDVLMIRLQAGF